MRYAYLFSTARCHRDRFYLLGLGDQIVGVTHECDYPHEAKQKPIVVRSAIDSSQLSSQEIDRRVGELLQAGKGLYTIDEEALQEAAPDIILTQGLVRRLRSGYNDVVKAAERWRRHRSSYRSTRTR